MKSLKSFLIIFFLFNAFLLKAQTGSISGKLTNHEGDICEFASLYLKNTSFGGLTDQNGNFKIENVQEGRYVLVCASLQIDTIEIPISIRSGKDTVIYIKGKRSENNLDDVVVTATRTEKVAENLPIPVKVISGEQIKQMGAMRLSDVLSEQTGLALVNDHGTGLQMQGFSSEYTLILLNGEPMIGRTAGTFDLTRISVGNIKRIEIVKGPSSSLYGSEALAGVVNIITETPKDELRGGFKARYGSNNTLNLSGDVSVSAEKFRTSFFADRYSTSGYTLGNSEEKTVPPYQNYTFQNTLSYKFNRRFLFSSTARFSLQNQENTYSVHAESNNKIKLNENGHQQDWNLHPKLTWHISENGKLVAQFYSTRYSANSIINRTDNGSLYDESVFIQTFNRPELQYTRSWRNNQETVVGAGSTIESVEATRYTSKQHFYNYYSFIQHDFTICKKINIIPGLRYDLHSVYGDQINPKLSASYRIMDRLTFRGSVGRGFKAPDFRQLYLNFNNAIEGYSVFGSEEISNQLLHLQQNGQISQILIDPKSLKPVKAESSVSWNIGWAMQPFKSATWQVNFFRNDIKDMIATSAVAIKTNGGSVFSYFNIARVYTQGLETDMSYKICKGLSLSAGYQYLIAKDKQVVSDIRNGLVYRRDPETLKTTKVIEKDYGGLLNRSRRMFNIKMFYSSQKGWTGTIRGVYRGRYGFSDTNGNLIVDTENEYVKGYWIWNLSIGKQLMDIFTLQAGIDNVMDFKNPLMISSIPGRLYYVCAQINLSKGDNKKNLSK